MCIYVYVSNINTNMCFAYAYKNMELWVEWQHFWANFLQRVAKQVQRSPVLSVGVGLFLVVILVGVFSILVAQLTQSYLELYDSMVGELGELGRVA